MTFEILGHLIRLQARSALADFPTADQHAAAADQVAQRHERPLVGVFTHWYRALRLAATGAPPQDAETAYRNAAAQLAGSGMPGVERGLLPLALLCLRVWRGLPADFDDETDWGPYAPWTRPLILLAPDRPADAAAALRRTPDPPRDLLSEALWCLTAQAAIALDDRVMMQRAQTELTPAAKPPRTAIADRGYGEARVAADLHSWAWAPPPPRQHHQCPMRPGGRSSRSK